MSRTRQMIELMPPAVFREARPEKFTLTGFTCPECHGNGWGWQQGTDHGTVFHRYDPWEKQTCIVCGGTGEVNAEVTVRWKGKEVKQ